MTQSDSTAASDAEYVDDRELARRTPIRRATWQWWRREGGGPPFYKLGRRCVYRWPDVEAWIAKFAAGGGK